MMRTIRAGTRLLGLACLLAFAVWPQLAIENVTLIHPESGIIRPSHSVVIVGDRITDVRPAGAGSIPDSYRRVDGAGQFLIPGLWDCHVHLTKAGENALPLFVANGVTSVRDMGSDEKEVLSWRRDIESGRRIGPRIRTSGRILESAANVARMKRDRTVEPVDRIRLPVANPDDARKAVAELARAGVDLIKVRTVPDQPTLEALAEAAAAARLPLTGHPVSDLRRLFGRLRSVEHLAAYPPLDSLTPEARSALLAEMRRAGTWMSTTLVNFHGSILVPAERAQALLADESGKLDFRRRYVRGYLLSDWREQVAEKTDEYLDQARRLLPGLYRDLKEMKRQNVRFLAGTDVGVAFMYPGFSLHDELEIYVQQLGFTPMETLAIAAKNPAEFFGLASRQGGIAAGQAADLVLLDASPLLDIRNTRKIRGVVSGGRYFDREQLDRILAQAARDTM